MRFRSAFFLLFLGLFGVLPRVTAQGLSDTFFTVGTSVEDTDEDGETWNYIVWQAEDLELLRGQTYAVYRKVGPANAGQPYALRGVVEIRKDPLSLGALIHRAESLGEDRDELEAHVDGLFENLMPISGLSLEEKLGAVIEGAEFDPEIFGTVVFLARRHPAIAMAIGMAYADPVSDGVEYTYEIRLCPTTMVDPDLDCDLVVGRLTLSSGKVVPLPAPGAPVEVPFLNNSGARDGRNNLAARLRWATPDDLRRRSLLQFGFNLYRMSAEEAIAAGYHLAPPTGADLAALVLEPASTTTRVNEAPILIDPLMTTAQAVNLAADPDTYYIIDDNDRYAPGGLPFQNGDEYYYFVTALDLLLRDGESSDGTQVLICDTLPPPAPSNLVVTNEYTYDTATATNRQHFKVTWDPSDVSKRQNPETVTAYRVYRWWSVEEMEHRAYSPDAPATATKGGFVGMVDAATTSFVDDGPNAPYMQTVRNIDGTVTVDQSYAGKTFWYSVRAVDESACGGNLSGNSAPEFGVLRDRRGPERPTGRVMINCLELRLALTNEGVEIRPWVETPQADLVYLEFVMTRDDPHVRYAEFAIDRGLPTEFDFGVHAFPLSGTDPLTVRFVIPEAVYTAGLLIHARAFGENGLTSSWINFDYPHQIPKQRTLQYTFRATTIAPRVIADGDCFEHPTTTGDGEVEGPIIEVDLTPTTEEYKVYRRVDEGPLTLIEQGLASAADVVLVIIEDLDMPINAARICYFAQLFDEHGNPSPMVRIGCIQTEAREELPVPMLSVPIGAGDQTDPAADLPWFCPPYGIERFKLWVRANDAEPLPDELGPQLRTKGSPVNFDGVAYFPYETVRISSNFGNGPEFIPRLEAIEAGREYTFFVQAVSDAGAVSGPSNLQTYQWLPDADDTVVGPNVPWPARPLPNLNSTFNEGVEAILYPDGVFDGGLVRIGRVLFGDQEIPPPSQDGTSEFSLPFTVVDPLDVVFENSLGEKLTPFVLYRFQVPNAEYAEVSGDVYQVSPLIESFAMEKLDFPATGDTYWKNYDSFLAASPSHPKDWPDHIDIFVKDTSPIITGATYRYLIVRYDPVTHEIAEVIPTNLITVP